ncbi:DUF3619 family protein [Methylophilus sp. Leaf414]|uniref:DUF3619 family protein n=1 Tax=Methylophilus sp. Leaf414 TaxID=1736371 RepID=UPI0006F90309|nr:DUF3619 family protein [Methylophilus sp. Leaf414]KQT33223.1 hypothetical protein ASG24_13060 [Methylophilus sp. Leaf414]
MSNQRHPEDDLPLPLRECVDLLKNDVTPLSVEVEARLTKARQDALRRFAETKQTSPMIGDILSWASFGHPRMLGAAALSVCLVVTMLLISNQHNDDALLLGADLPVEAFVDNGFEPWHYSEHI